MRPPRLPSVHTTPKKFEHAIQQSTVILDLYLGKTLSGKSRDYRDVIVFKRSIFKMFSIHTKMQIQRFQIRAFFKKPRFRPGLVWMVRLTEKIKLPFHVPQAGVVSTWPYRSGNSWRRYDMSRAHLIRSRKQKSQNLTSNTLANLLSVFNFNMLKMASAMDLLWTVSAHFTPGTRRSILQPSTCWRNFDIRLLTYSVSS